MKISKKGLGLLLGVAFLTMTGCAVPQIYLNQSQVDTFAKEKFPGSKYVSKVSATQTDADKIYTYEDEYGRKFFMTTTIDHADDLSGRKIDWMYRRGIDYTYEKDIFEAELSQIENYLQEEGIMYEVKENLYSSVLSLYLENTQEDTLKHISEVYATIDNTYLRYNMEEEFVKGVMEDNLGAFFMDIIFYDADGNKQYVSNCYGLSVSKNPAKRRTQNEIYEIIKAEVNK